MKITKILIILAVFLMMVGLVSAVECTDSDEGIDLYIRGTTILGDEIKLDECRHSVDGLRLNTLELFYCDIDFGQETIQSRSEECPNGCVDGACVRGGWTLSGTYKVGETVTAEDGTALFVEAINFNQVIINVDGVTDTIASGNTQTVSGVSITVNGIETQAEPVYTTRQIRSSCKEWVPRFWGFGSYCKSYNYISEQVQSGTKTIYLASMAFEKRAVEEPVVCTDTDGGLNYAVKGTACQGSKCLEDACQDERYLFENDCGQAAGIPSGHSGLGGSRYDCPNGCSDDACIEESVEVPVVEVPVVEGTLKPLFGVKNYFTKNEYRNNPVGINECYSLPNDYIQLCLDSLTLGDADYADYSMEVRSSPILRNAMGIQTTTLLNKDAIYLKAGATDGFELFPFEALGWSLANVNTAVKTKEVYLAIVKAEDLGSPISESDSQKLVLAVFYRDNVYSGLNQLYGAYEIGPADGSIDHIILRINHGMTKDNNMILRYKGGGQSDRDQVLLAWDIVGDSSIDLAEGEDGISSMWGFVNNNAESLGLIADLEEIGEMNWTSDALPNGMLHIGTKDEDHRTRYGVIIKNPRLYSAGEKVALSVPNDQLFTNVVIRGNSYEPATAIVADGGVSVVSSVGGKAEKIPIGKGLTGRTFFDTVMDQIEISTLLDGTIPFGSSNYAVKEELLLSDQNDPAIHSSLSVVPTPLSKVQDGFNTNVFMTASRNKIKYQYSIDENFNPGGVSRDNPLRVTLLGKDEFVIVAIRENSFDAYINGATTPTTIYSGDAYVGEDPNNPDWVWDFNFGTVLPEVPIGVEYCNYFVEGQSVYVADVDAGGKIVKLIDSSLPQEVAVVEVLDTLNDFSTTPPTFVRESIASGNTQTVSGILITVGSVGMSRTSGEATAKLCFEYPFKLIDQTPEEPVPEPVTLDVTLKNYGRTDREVSFEGFKFRGLKANDGSFAIKYWDSVRSKWVSRTEISGGKSAIIGDIGITVKLNSMDCIDKLWPRKDLCTAKLTFSVVPTTDTADGRVGSGGTGPTGTSGGATRGDGTIPTDEDTAAIDQIRAIESEFSGNEIDMGLIGGSDTTFLGSAVDSVRDLFTATPRQTESSDSLVGTASRGTLGGGGGTTDPLADEPIVINRVWSWSSLRVIGRVTFIDRLLGR